MREIMLCIDGESLAHPEMIGLEGEALESQEWLLVVADAAVARKVSRQDGGIREVWVASDDAIEPINLAAAMKSDRANLSVCLVAEQDGGSLRSRAKAAGIDELISGKELVERYAHRKAAARFAHDLPDTLHPAAVPVPPSPARTESIVPQHAARAVEAQEHPKGEIPVLTRRERQSYVLTVVGASGGTGKSTVSVLLALLSQAFGCKTLLVDADMQFGDAALMLGMRRALSIDRALSSPDSLSSLVAGEGKPALLASPAEVEKSELVGSELPALINRLKSSFDVIVVNTGSFWTEQHIQLIESSTNTLFLLDQRPTSIRATKRALELCARCGVASRPFLFAVNRCARNALMTSIDISCALKGAHVFEFKDGGHEVEEMMGSGAAFHLLEARNDLCLSLEDFLLEVLPDFLTDLPQETFHGKAAKSRGLSLLRKRRKTACL